MQPILNETKRVVVKLGTQIVIDKAGELADDRLKQIVAECAELVSRGKEVILVSSGAVGLGRKLLKLTGTVTLAEKQACAAVGQNLLMDVYRDLFETHGLITAQLLLTAHDFSDRQRYLNLRETLEKLLEMRVIPIINENDTVSTMELKEENQNKSFGDNDKLSAIVASKLDADLLVILTNVDGIFTENPEHNPDAQVIALIERFDQLTDIRVDGQSAYGRGGMTSKIEAARIAAISGVCTMITSGLKPRPIIDIFEENGCRGTLVLPQGNLPGRKRWIGLASGYNGVIIVNEGAKRALIERCASLLPSGIQEVQGDFQSRQVVSIQDAAGVEVGRGLINFSSEDTRKIQGCQSSEITVLLGPVEDDVVIQRDNLVIFEEYSV